MRYNLFPNSFGKVVKVILVIGRPKTYGGPCTLSYQNVLRFLNCPLVLDTLNFHSKLLFNLQSTIYISRLTVFLDYYGFSQTL